MPIDIMKNPNNHRRVNCPNTLGLLLILLTAFSAVEQAVHGASRFGARKTEHDTDYSD
jgi:hypothetical protein